MKYKYVELSRGNGLRYEERIAKESDVRSLIKQGWRITRLSKVCYREVLSKWSHAIAAMENLDEN